MRKLPVVLLLLALAAGCGKKRFDRIVTPDGQVVAGKITALDDTGVTVDGLAVPVPAAEEARIVLSNGAVYTGVVSGGPETYSIVTEMGEISVEARGVTAIYWPPSARSVDLIDVPANSGWYNTHLQVEEGALVTLAAAGRALTDIGLAGPSGQERFSSSISQVPAATDGQLVMRVGQDAEPVVVGESWQGSTETSGELFLAINSPPDSTSGYYTVSLVVDQPAEHGHWAIYPANR